MSQSVKIAQGLNELALLDYVTQFKNTLSAASIATAVWASASRPLTKANITPVIAANTALAAGATADLRPAAGVWRDLYVDSTGAAGQYELGMFDGSTFLILPVPNTAGSPCFVTTPGPNGPFQLGGYSAVGIAIKNISGSPGAFTIVGSDQPL